MTPANPRPAGRLDVISDAICPWCWIGKRQLARALDALAAEGLTFAVHWRPFQLNPEMPVAGVERAAYRTAKFGSLERSRELDAQVAANGATVGLEFRLDRQARTPNTVAAHRVIRLAGEHGVQDAVVEALFAAYFRDGRDIGDPAVLAAVAGEAGLDPAVTAAHLASEAGLAEVLEEDRMFRQAGISGVPSFALDGHVLFSGALPAEQMAGAFRRALSILRERAA